MTARTIVIGIDPGATETGVLARSRDNLLAATVVVRARRGPMPDLDYLAEVQQAATDAAWHAHPGDRVVVAIEEVKAPGGYDVGAASGERRPIAPGPIIGAATVAGAVAGWWINDIDRAEVVVVPAGGHGGAPIPSYPRPLRPTRGRGAGRDRNRHLRSAWDIAGVALPILRQRAARRLA